MLKKRLNFISLLNKSFYICTPLGIDDRKEIRDLRVGKKFIKRLQKTLKIKTQILFGH